MGILENPARNWVFGNDHLIAYARDASSQARTCRNRNFGIFRFAKISKAACWGFQHFWLARPISGKSQIFLWTYLSNMENLRFSNYNHYNYNNDYDNHYKNYNDFKIGKIWDFPLYTVYRVRLYTVYSLKDSFRTCLGSVVYYTTRVGAIIHLTPCSIVHYLGTSPSTLILGI